MGPDGNADERDRSAHIQFVSRHLRRWGVMHLGGAHALRNADTNVAFVSRSNEFIEIMDMLDKRLNDKGKNWRHVLKALKVMDYCLHEGSELVVTWAKQNIFIIKTLREFQYIDEDGKDVGQNGRFCRTVILPSTIG
jgi:hypothetical protein